MLDLHQAYYAQAYGRWRGYFTLSLQRPVRMLTGPMPLAYKGRVLLLIALQTLMGRWTIETEVHALTSHEVAHRFWLKKWGITLYASEEQFSLLSNGRDLTLHLQDAVWPFLHKKQSQGTHAGTVFSAQEALYQMPFLGSVYPMRTRLTPETFQLTLQTPWGQGRGIMSHQRPAS